MLQQSSQGKSRKYWIDALRGLAMLLVIFGHHCPEFTEYFVITSPIKIPLFFSITGYVFNGRDGDVKGFFKNLFWKLIVPWFFLSLLPLKLIIAASQLSVTSAGRYIYEFISGGILWYMPCCILAEIIQFFVRKFFKGRCRYAVMLVIAALGLILSHFEIGTFAGFNTACIAQIFIAIGLWLKEENVLRDKRELALGIGIALYVIGIIVTLVAYPGQNLDVHTNSYYNLLICALMIAVGCSVCFIGVEWFDRRHPIKKNNPLVFIGQNTLVYYMLCSYVIKVWNKGLELIHLSIQDGPAEWIVNTVIMCIGCAVLAIMINRFAPLLVGKWKKA